MFHSKDLLSETSHSIFIRTELKLKDLASKEIAQYLDEKKAILIKETQSKFEDFITFSNQFISKFQSDPSSFGNRSTLDDLETTYEAVKGRAEVVAHGELYSLPSPPDFIFFYCNQPSSEGGETTLYDGLKVAQSLSPHVLKMFSNRLIKYKHTWSYEQWSHYFKNNNITQSLETLEALPNIKILPAKDKMIRFEYTTSALTKSGAFVNGIANILSRKSQAINHVTWNNDEEISLEIESDIQNATMLNEKSIQWNAGEILILDNHSVMHGRKSFFGDRKIAVRFGKKIQ